MSKPRKTDPAQMFLFVVGVAIIVLVALLSKQVFARDLGQWDAADPDTREWYKALMQPDIPTASCCGEADAYWCDDYYGRSVTDADGKSATVHAYCKITDDRDDAPRGRPHVDVGTEIEIPPNKLKWDKSNPTGHGIVFLSRGGYVFCFVQPGGV